MRIAVISDIHANWHALQAVWADLAARAPDAVMCLGDLVGYGAPPNEVIDFVRQYDIPVLMGNYDDSVGYDCDDCGCVYKDPVDDALGHQSLLWTREHVTADRKAYLRGLPFDRRETYDGRQVRFVHGSPRRSTSISTKTAPRRSSRMWPAWQIATCSFFGHTHLPYQKRVGRTLFVNAGSVGKPKDGDPRASYLVADFAPEPEIKLRRVEYDIAAAARAVRENGLPAHFADLLETGGAAPAGEHAGMS